MECGNTGLRSECFNVLYRSECFNVVYYTVRQVVAVMNPWHRHLFNSFQAVSDITGREDLIEALRLRLLLLLGASFDCNVVARGDTATRLACRVIAAACKVRFECTVGRMLAAISQLRL